MAKILIVDDSEILRLDLKETLTKAGHTVLEGKHGAEGLAVAQSNKDIQLVITDLNMPEMDGITMSKMIHETPGLEKLPTFMLTTDATQEMKIQGKAAGVMLWIVKPFVADKVLAAVAKVTGG